MSTNYMRDKLHRNQMIMPWAQSDTISSEDAAAMMHCTSETVRRMLEEGKIKGFRIRPNKKKSPWRISRTSVEAYVDRVLAAYHLDTSSAKPASATNAAAGRAKRGP